MLFGTAETGAGGSPDRTGTTSTSTDTISRLSLEGMAPAERRSIVGVFEKLGLVAPTLGDPPTSVALVRPLKDADVRLLEILGFVVQFDALPPAPAPRPAPPTHPMPPPPTTPILDAEWTPSADPEPAAVQRIVDRGAPLDAPPPVSAPAPSTGLAHASPTLPARPNDAPPPASPKSSKWTIALAATAAAGAAGAFVLAYRAFQRSAAQDSEVSRLKAENQALRGAVDSIDRTLKAYPTDDAGVDQAVDQELAALAEQRAAYRQQRGSND